MRLSPGDSFNQQRWAERAPRLTELVAGSHDMPLGSPVDYWISPYSTRMALLRGTLPEDTPRSSMSEADALNEVNNFFSEGVATLTDDQDNHELARWTQENLTFIPTKAFDRAVTGLAGLWKTFLDEDRRHRIVAPTRVLDTANRKSGDYLYGKIVNHLDKHYNDDYQSRISNDMDGVRRLSRGAFTKVVVLDDYSLSGTQLRSGFSRITEHRGFSRSHTEVHLVAATEAQLAQQNLTGETTPTYAYYKIDQGSRERPLISGSHSSADFGFVDTIERIAEQLDPNRHRPLPALANIIKPY